MDVEKIRENIRDVRVFCGRYFPFVVIPLSYIRIIATEVVPTAGVDERGVLALNSGWWSDLTVPQKRFVLVHEVLHLVLAHPLRWRGFNRLAFNLAADGKVNTGIVEVGLQGVEPPSNPITLETIATATNLCIEDLRKMSTEEIARILEENLKSENLGDDASEDLLEGTANGEVVQEGSNKLYVGKAKEDLKETWRRLAEKARAFAKQAGSMPNGLERLVNEIIEVKPPWHIMVRFGLKNSHKQDSSFAYPNRRSDDLPGPLGWRHTIWCLVDTSGSINEDLLKKFLGIVKHEARNASVRVIAWDAYCYDVLRAESPSQVAKRVAAKMRGGGGTIILPVLQKIYKLMKRGDAVIILTDGDIADKSRDEIQSWFAKVARKAGFAVIGYTHTPVEAKGWQNRFLELG
jgi:predicted metal-dependent peptidase